MQTLPKDCTVSEWRAWLAGSGAAVYEGQCDGVLGVSFELKISEDFGHMMPVLRTSGTPGLSGDTRCARSQLRRSIAVIDAMEDLLCAVIGVRVWTDGKCPCSRCSRKGLEDGKPCPMCNGACFR